MLLLDEHSPRIPAAKRRLMVWPLGTWEAHFLVKMAFGGALRAQVRLSGALRAQSRLSGALRAQKLHT